MEVCCKDKTDIYLDLLEHNQMNNSVYYAKALCISQRVRLKIEKLKTLKRKSQIHPESNTSSVIDDKPTLSYYTESNNTASDESDIATPSSPTPFKDKLDQVNEDNDLLYISSKALPIINKTHNNPPSGPPPKCLLPPIPSLSDENQRLDSAVDLATLHDKSLPTLPSRMKKTKPLPSPPRPPPPPKIFTINTYQQQQKQHQHQHQQQQLSSAASRDAAYGVPILHVEKKKLGIKGFITRTYRLDSIIVTRNVFPNGLWMAKDCYTDRRMAVLQIMVKTSSEDSFGFTFIYSKSSVSSSREYDLSHLRLVPDDRMQMALFMWIKRQNHLPSLSLASQVFRRGLKLYVVYDTVLFQN